MKNNLIVDLEVFEGPNDEGKTFVCPSKLCDPNLVFKSERTPKFVNVAHAPHLSFITKVMVLSIANIVSPFFPDLPSFF